MSVKKLALIALASGVSAGFLATWIPLRSDIGIVIGALAANVYVLIAARRERRETERLLQWAQKEADYASRVTTRNFR